MVKFPRILLVGKVHFMLRYTIRQHYKAKQLTNDICSFFIERKNLTHKSVKVIQNYSFHTMSMSLY